MAENESINSSCCEGANINSNGSIELINQISLLHDMQGVSLEETKHRVIWTCSIKIAGHWTADEFSDLFAGVSYNYRIFIERCIRINAYLIHVNRSIHGKPGDEKYDYFTALNYYKDLGLYELSVKRVHYGSTGSMDFTGLGAALGHIKDLILEYFPTKEKKLERFLPTIRIWIDIMREIGFTDQELRRIIVNSETIFKALVDAGKITGVCLNSLVDKSKHL